MSVINGKQWLYGHLLASSVCVSDVLKLVSQTVDQMFFDKKMNLALLLIWSDDVQLW